jgi:hypothetical protein
MRIFSGKIKRFRVTQGAEIDCVDSIRLGWYDLEGQLGYGYKSNLSAYRRFHVSQQAPVDVAKPFVLLDF